VIPGLCLRRPCRTSSASILAHLNSIGFGHPTRQSDLCIFSWSKSVEQVVCTNIIRSRFLPWLSAGIPFGGQPGEYQFIYLVLKPYHGRKSDQGRKVVRFGGSCGPLEHCFQPLHHTADGLQHCRCTLKHIGHESYAFAQKRTKQTGYALPR
jgi:hypothetical protein